MTYPCSGKIRSFQTSAAHYSCAPDAGICGRAGCARTDSKALGRIYTGRWETNLRSRLLWTIWEHSCSIFSEGKGRECCWILEMVPEDGGH